MREFGILLANSERGTVQGAVATWWTRKSLPTRRQVATAPCTVPIRQRYRTPALQRLRHFKLLILSGFIQMQTEAPTSKTLRNLSIAALLFGLISLLELGWVLMENMKPNPCGRPLTKDYFSISSLLGFSAIFRFSIVPKLFAPPVSRPRYRPSGETCHPARRDRSSAPQARCGVYAAGESTER